MVPVQMTKDADYQSVRRNSAGWRRLRCHYDFEYWAVSCVMVKDKQSFRDIPFRLNEPQRTVLGVLEGDRLAGLPIRIIILKARQWGGSTLVQMYMAWIQTVLRRNWHSVICAHVKDTSSVILGMYSKMLANYPKELWEGDSPAGFRPFERSGSVRSITGRDCRVTLGSSEKPDSIRGADYAMAHLSETAFWRATPGCSPEDVISAVIGSVALMPMTLVAVESTARGVGNYFHREWLRCKSGRGDKHAVFVPWQAVEFNRLECADAGAVFNSFDEQDRWLWLHGCTTDRIHWHRLKRREIDSVQRLNAEFPGDDLSAFSATDRCVFNPADVDALRTTCCPEAVRGELGSNGVIADPTGRLKVWLEPEKGESYVVAVDVGGRSASADWSVIAVLKCGAVPEVVAQWRGHIDHDLLAEKSVALARYYNTALLVIESNTFETEHYGGSGDSNLFVLNRIAESYPNMYVRESFDKVSGRASMRVGFHTNRSTKAMLISDLIAAVREHAYIERDDEACNELMLYEQLDNGSFAAKAGFHDDILMTRAIALFAARSQESAKVKLPENFSIPDSW